MKITTLALLAPALTSSSILLPRQTTTDTSYACNNSPDLCSRSYANITHLGAHDSPFLRDGSNSQNSITFADSGNQNVNSTTQLDAGVRLLTAQVHSHEGAWHLCHSTCDLLDVGTLSAWLSEIRVWLDGHPHEVVTLLLVNADDASPSALASEFEAADIASYGYVPPATTFQQPLQTWPTLGEMIQNNSRLVTFIASLTRSESAPYLLDEFSHVFENSYNNTNPSSFTCTPDRPTTLSGSTTTALSAGYLPLVNHFLYSTSMGFGIQTPDIGNISTTNAASGTGSLGEATERCTQEYGGRQPWAVLVDFFDQGDTLQVVDQLNRVTNPVGRGDVPEAAGAAMSTGGAEGKVRVPPLSKLVGLAGAAAAIGGAAF